MGDTRKITITRYFLISLPTLQLILSPFNNLIIYASNHCSASSQPLPFRAIAGSSAVKSIIVET